ncbi:hypothetical protein CL653_02345 [bacterium]|nr:hypothetical protein [bacterium]
MNGSSKLTAVERLENFEESVDNYINSNFLSIINFSPEDCAKALNLKAEELSALKASECTTYAYLIYTYANHLQEEVGKNNIKLNFATDNLQRIIAEEINNYGFDKYTKHEIKVQQIINSNEFASKLELIRKHAQARVDRLTDKVRDVRRMAETLLEKGRKVGY